MSFSLTVEVNQKQCPNCGIVYCIPTRFEDACKESGRSWHCPNGHERSWGQTEDQKKVAELTARLETEKRNCEARIRAASVEPVGQRKGESRSSIQQRIWTPERRAEHSEQAKERWRKRREEAGQ